MPETRQIELRSGARRAKRLTHGERIPLHRHEQAQLVYAASGVLSVTTTHGTWLAPGDRAVWTPAGFGHAHRAHGHTDVRMVSFPAELASGLPNQPTVLAVSALLREIVFALTEPAARSTRAREHLLQVAVTELVDVPEQPLHLPEARDDRLRAAVERLEADPADPVTLAQLGREVGCSERTLSRLFHTELGSGFRQWRTQLRLHHALVRLADGSPVGEVATICGWANPSSFIEAFTATLGQTPGRYQAALRATQRSARAATDRTTNARRAGRRPIAA